jgi:pimeloyl-ACP methyl ester carboxylesterase
VRPSGRIRTFTNDGLTFDVLDGGPVDGQVGLLLHGFPERASHWAEVSAVLHEHGVRTVAPDQRGYSRRARPRARTAYRLSRLVGDVVALVGVIGAPVHLVGHDWGAAIAWRTAAAHPDLVRTLTTVSVPHPAAFARSLLTSSQALRSWYVLACQPPRLVESLADRAPWVLARLLRASGLHGDEIRRVHAEILESGALPGALGWYRAIPVSVPAAVGPVRVPTTHVWSDGDVSLARRGAELTDRYVDAPYELRILHGVSHWVPTQAPDQLAAAILDRITAEPER